MDEEYAKPTNSKKQAYYTASYFTRIYSSKSPPGDTKIQISTKMLHKHKNKRIYGTANKWLQYLALLTASVV